PPPSRPRISAESSSGASSVTGRVLLVGFLDAGLVLGVFVVEQDAVGRAVHVVVLAAVDRPEEQPDGQGDHDHGDGDHYVEGSHAVSGSAGRIALRRSELLSMLAKGLHPLYVWAASPAGVGRTP